MLSRHRASSSAGCGAGSICIGGRRNRNGRVACFAAEAVTTEPTSSAYRRRGGGDDRRSIVHYRYVAADQERTGRDDPAASRSRSLRASAHRSSVRYLASDPDASWIEGDAPRGDRPLAGVRDTARVHASPQARCSTLIRRQSHLLTYGRPTMGIGHEGREEKDRQGHLLARSLRVDGAERRNAEGRYNHGKKQPPAVGTMMPIVYDRDTEKSARYPLSLVSGSDS